MSKKGQSILLKDDTFENLKSLDIEIGGITLDTHDQKVSHLIWFFKHYKNNNGNKL